VHSDVVKTRFWHTRTRIRARIRFVDLERPKNNDPDTPLYSTIHVYVATSQGKGQEVFMELLPRRVSAHLYAHGAIEPTNCVISDRVDYRSDVVLIDFPRTCVHDPQWVRLGVISTAELPGELCIDDALDDGYAYGTRHPNRPRLSARLYQA
jgi:hypothetical protein